MLRAHCRLHIRTSSGQHAIAYIGGSRLQANLRSSVK